MNKRVINAFICAAFSALLVNCSVHAGGGSGDTPTPTPNIDTQVFDRPSIPGPAVLGTWQSDCIEDSLNGGSRQETMTFLSVTDFSYSNQHYSDYSCKNATDKDAMSGKYQFAVASGGSVYEVDYNYLDHHVTYKMRGEKLDFQTDKIYISEFTFGVPTVNYDVALKKVTAQPAPTPTPSPTPAPGACTDYSGTYQMNTDYFKITQTACSEIDWTWLPTYDDPTQQVDTFIMDGQTHTVNGRSLTAVFSSNGLFTVSGQTDSGDIATNIYSFQKVPCNLINPDGSLYLTRQVYINGVEQTDSCRYWVKTNR